MAKDNFITEKELTSSPLLAREQLGKQLGNVFILAPHPDDEALGCGGIIQFLIQQNCQVLVCFMTSGDASHPDSKEYPPHILAELREQEATNSCEILGVPTSNLFFLRQPDSLLGELDSEKENKLIQKLSTWIETSDIDTLLLPWRRDPHKDHRSTYILGKKASEILENKVQLVEYPIWLWKNSNPHDWPNKAEVETFRLNIEEVLATKTEAIFAHTSQTSQLITDAPEGFILTEDLLSPFLTHFEYYFFNIENDKPTLNQEYFDTLYANNPDPWNFNHSTYEKSKYEKIDEFIKGKHFKNGLELGCSIGIHTRFIAPYCDQLLAIDISEDAVESAKDRNKDLSHVTFEVKDMLSDFPKGNFDFISMCELGYYFSKEALMSIFENISDNLIENGILLMVHWTSFVREYPLTGKQVHQIFDEFNHQYKSFTKVSSYVHQNYELFVFKKQKS